jgi:putative NADPH-quinone reductase
MSRRILIIDGHPDPGRHLIHALADAYARWAEWAGHEAKRLDLAALDFPLLASAEAWEQPPPPVIARAQRSLAWAEHIAIFFPLWLGDMPALLKAFFEQVMRPGFAFEEGGRPGRSGLLGGRSAQIVVTMGMPALWYRVYYRAHSVKSIERNILKMVGIGPVQQVLIGGVGPEMTGQDSWIEQMFGLGEAGRPAMIG